MAKQTPRTLLGVDRDVLRLARRMDVGRPGIDLTNRERECLEAVRRDVEAREALRFLARKSRRAEEWWITEFVATAWAEKATRTLFRRPRPGDSGPEELLTTAADLFKTAKTIRKLNAERSWHPECPDLAVFQDEDVEKEPLPGGGWCLCPHRRAFEETKRVFENLPRALEMYAESLSYKASRELGFRRQQRRRGKLQHQMEANLLQFVHQLTGHKYREKVAAILRVVNPKAGIPAVEADSQYRRESRKRKKA